MRLRGKKAATEADRCAEAAEEHRLKSDDLVQQTRSANATELSAGFAYEVTRLTLIGLIIGLATTVAAAFAAYYARKAYREAAKTRKHQKWASRLELQPFLYWRTTETQVMKGTEEIGLQFYIVIHNTGHTPALNVVTKIRTSYRTLDRTYERELNNKTLKPFRVPPRCDHKVLDFVSISEEEWEKVSGWEAEIMIDITVTFDSRFAKGKSFRERKAGSGDAFEKGDFFAEYPSPDPIIPGLLTFDGDGQKD